MQASPRCMALIKEFEGFSATPYDDVAGCLTWGYGHLGRHGEQPPECISEEAATALLGRDLAEAEACVNAYVSAILNQDQFDALCSFVFNLGCGALKRSTLLKLLNAGDFDSAMRYIDESVSARSRSLADAEEAVHLPRRFAAEDPVDGDHQAEHQPVQPDGDCAVAAGA